MNGASSDSNYAAARRQILPPVVFLIALIAMAVLHWVVPLATVVSAPYNLAGIPLIAVGLLGAMLASNRFRRVGTPVRPFEQSTVLVTGGLFRFTRNPMYFGLALMLLGTAVGFGTLSPFFAIVVFVWWIQSRFIV